MVEWRAENKSMDYIVADNVRLYRRKANLTQFELAEKAELSLESIKRLEAGKKGMSLENFMRVADALQIPLSYLLYKNIMDVNLEERIWSIMGERNKRQQEYLLHILEELAQGLDGLV